MRRASGGGKEATNCSFGPALDSAPPSSQLGFVMARIDTIRSKLNERLTPTRLNVIDDSGRHVGHAGARPEGETHFSVEVVSPDFKGLNRVARQRLVYGILADEFAAGLHALALTTLTPEEDAQAPV
jgi:BolA protein